MSQKIGAPLCYLTRRHITRGGLLYEETSGSSFNVTAKLTDIEIKIYPKTCPNIILG